MPESDARSVGLGTTHCSATYLCFPGTADTGGHLRLQHHVQPEQDEELRCRSSVP